MDKKSSDGYRQVKEKGLTKFDAWEDGFASVHGPGFQVRDLLRFFIVDCIVILALHLLYMRRLFPTLTYYVVFTLAGKAVLASYLAWIVASGIDGWGAAGGRSAGKAAGWLAGLALVFAGIPAYMWLTGLNLDLVVGLCRRFGYLYEPAPQDVALIIFDGPVAPWVRWSLVFFAVVVGPVMEEAAFRGVGMEAFGKKGGTARAILATSLLFGLYHFDAVRFLPLAALGVALGLARTLSQSLWCPIAAHIGYNTMILLWMWHAQGQT